MDVIEAISTRRSIRSYTNQILEPAIIDQLLRLGTMAATGSNQQPWGFVVIQGQEKIEAHNQAIKADLLARLDSLPHLQQYRPGLENNNFSVLNHASNLIIVYGDTKSHYYRYDCTLAAANIMLAGRSMGIESCWIGFGEYYFNSPAFKAAHQVPEGFELVCPMTLGIPAACPAEGPVRRPPLVFSR
ncbi:nitroreductase family protein [Pseudoflavonifractor sp. 524-17]|uniref:nitroreductase family protein n=1 Tax=Pseudoflavonifractor sp. 524-17 TaxID=2304577 RepID=UPI00137B5E59|nr:nitroreductase family protein [Pseudoflavonifractor sp. 524-17]NCE64177.1 nitroreductase family protein [Pseudoflavonifractor sp. 524-17]